MLSKPSAITVRLLPRLDASASAGPNDLPPDMPMPDADPDTFPDPMPDDMPIPARDPDMPPPGEVTPPIYS